MVVMRRRMRMKKERKMRKVRAAFVVFSALTG
jgi:hypothetical protein